MYIAFTGLSFSRKKDLQQTTIDYLINNYNTPPQDIEIVSDPKSTKLGNLIVNISRIEYDPNMVVEGLLYLAGSCDVYDHVIKPATISDKHIIERGYFTEILAYQGNLLNNVGLDWQSIKSFYQTSILQSNGHTDIIYPDIIFICINSYEQAKVQMKVQGVDNTSFETKLTQEEFEYYNKLFIESYNVIKQDNEFTEHTKLILLDNSKYILPTDAWRDIVQPEIDMLLQGVVILDYHIS